MTNAKHQEVTFYFDTKEALPTGQTDAPVIAIRPFESGFHPIYTRSPAAELNKPDMTEEILESALSASIAASWNAPAAIPARNYAIAKGHCEAMAEREAMDAANAAGMRA
jgi:hypothetical protein